MPFVSILHLFCIEKFTICFFFLLSQVRLLYGIKVNLLFLNIILLLQKVTVN